MNIGLYFGSFNPIHVGHLIIANHLYSNSYVDEVWFIVSPQNPFKKNTGLLNQNHRLQMVRTALEGELKLKASNIEFKLPKPSYTINTLAYLKEKYPGRVFKIILGSDGFQNINKWKNYKIILQNYKILVYKRPGFEIRETFGANISVADAPLLEISSTHIRNMIRTGKSIRYLVTDSVKEEIERNNYYGSQLENPPEQ